jgi:hypothetical protein
MSMFEGMYKDDFDLKLRRQGWHLIRSSPLYSDLRVIAVRNTLSPRNIKSSARPFFEFIGQRTVRKIIRAVLSTPQSEESLQRICANGARRQDILRCLAEDNLLSQEGSHWTAGSELDGIHDIGATVEWYVAEWFRYELEAPARHGVYLEEIRNGGDLDVVAFVETMRIWVECKTVPPASISKADLGRFLQRNYYFNPEIALLLVDTEDSVQPVVDGLNNILRDMHTKLVHLIDPALPENAAIEVPKVLPQQELPDQQRRFRGLYWGPRNVYVANVQREIGDTLDAVLRLYHSQIRHYLFLGGPAEYAMDYINGTVTKIEQPE